jgi:mercuric ion binding protein
MNSRRSIVKRFSIVLIALALAWSLQAETKTAAFEVSGWTCASCASATRIALKKLEGVQEVKTNPDEKEALVTYDDAKVTPERMVQAIAKLGYKATQKNGAGPANSTRSQTGVSPALAQDRNVSPDRVSFFEVPLECGAAEGLGCGSAAKPILTELTGNPEITDARINYPGTVLAVVWKEPGSRKDSEVEALFDRNRSSAAVLRGDAREKALKQYRSDQWYGAAEVDRLSEQEARVIASRLVNRAKPRLGASPERLAALTEDLTAVFARGLKGNDEGCDTGGEIEQELVKAASKYLNAEQLAELRKAGEKGVMALPGEAK